MTVATDLLNAPFPMLVRNLGVGIAEAQLELDMVSLKIARMMAGEDVALDDENAATASSGDAGSRRVQFSDGESYTLLELGFTPTFYQFVDTVIELKLSISMSRETEQSRRSAQMSAGGGGIALPVFAAGGVRASAVSASYSSKYQYAAEGSSVMRTKLVPLPAPALLEERIRRMIDSQSS